MSFNILLIACLIYTLLLFAVAFSADRFYDRKNATWLHSPIIYTLSISVYCTAWTFYGSVGYATRNGIEFLAIYIGPTLVFIGWWWLLRKLVRVGRTQRITSIADMISSRYGKDSLLAVLVTILAVISATPYIALQLQSLTLSFSVFSTNNSPDQDTTGLWISAGLIFFTIMFGTRNVDANERHHGLVTAIAFEAVVKLVALLCVGIFVIWGVSNGPSDLLKSLQQSISELPPANPSRWTSLIFLSATAIICLPRMFQVIVVENIDERQLATASWAFPTYLLLISLFIMPIALVGQTIMPANSNPDLYVLSIPLENGNGPLALLAFLGGFSSATSMVIISAIALSTMVSNHIIMPIWLRVFHKDTQTAGDVKGFLLRSRRLSITFIILLGYLYFQLTGGSVALASIGMIAFAGAAQVLPAMVGGLFWRGATRNGAISGITIGAIIWLFTLFLPSFEGHFILSSDSLEHGLWGVKWLTPQALFGLSFGDNLVHSVFWSMLANTFSFIFVSLISIPSPIERVQGNQFVNVFNLSKKGSHSLDHQATAEDLFALAQRILGTSKAHELFSRAAKSQNLKTGLPAPTQGFVSKLERDLAGSVGAATAHAMISRVSHKAPISVEDLYKMADETAQIMEHSTQLETKSKELSETAKKLQDANTMLKRHSAQRDAFLSHVSHELRTPMTSIRSFSEILRDNPDLSSDQAQRFLTTINEESQRLTRLLDEILDLSILESGRIEMRLDKFNIQNTIARAIASTEGICFEANITLSLENNNSYFAIGDFDRLSQVIINLISNAVKYGNPINPKIHVQPSMQNESIYIDVWDNGTIIPLQDHARIFEEFVRLDPARSQSSSGLGLAISKALMQNMNGNLQLIDSKSGNCFRITLPMA